MATNDAGPWSGAGPSTAPAELLARQVDRLVEASVKPLRHGGLQRWAARARYAQPVMALSAHDAVGRFRVLVPERADASVDRLAIAVTTVSGVRQRFPWAAVRLASFDDASALTRRQVAGSVIDANLLEIHVHRDLVLASHDEVEDPGASTWLRMVVVHECWHVVEAVLDATNYRGSIAFQRALGGLLRLESLGDAYRPGPRATVEDRAAALAQLRDAVGDYATTAPREATAELFTAWWLGVSTHQLVSAFGALVDEHLPREV